MMCIHTLTHTYVHTYVHSHILYILTLIHTHTYVRMYLCMYVRMYIHSHYITWSMISLCKRMHIRTYVFEDGYMTNTISRHSQSCMYMYVVHTYVCMWI